MNTKISQLARFAGITILLLTALVSAQTDTFKIKGTFIGDVAPVEVTATPQGTSRGGGAKTVSSGAFLYTNLSVLWSGTLHFSATFGGYSFTPQDTLLKNVRYTEITIAMRDTARPNATFFYPTTQSLFTVDKTDSIKICASDNSKQLKSLRFDYSTDKGVTWDSIKNDTILKGLFVYYKPWTLSNYSCPFTPKKACDSCIIRVIIKDSHDLLDTSYVSVKVVPSTQIKKGFNHPIIEPQYSKEIFDLTGRKITGTNKISKCYAVKAGTIRTKVILR